MKVISTSLIEFKRDPLWFQSSVVGIVHEKMLRTEAFSHPEQLQAFLSQLYVYLVDQMHLALNMVTGHPSPTPPHSSIQPASHTNHSPSCTLIISPFPPSPHLNHLFTFTSPCPSPPLSCTRLQTEEEPQEVTGVQPFLDVSQLRHFAREAELSGDLQLAAQYYQEVTADPGV